MKRRAFNFRSKLRWQSWVVVVGFGLAIYFGYHVVNGSRGLLASQKVSDELRLAEKKLARTKSERQRLELRVERLRDGTLDHDLVDELARETLSMTEPDDVIILLEPAPATEAGRL